MPLYFIRDDITKVKADALVLPANNLLEQGSGASRSIYIAAGEIKLENELRLKYPDGCKIGEAVATMAYRLEPDVKWIIHAVCPQWIDGKTGEAEFLYSAYKKSLLLAKEKGCKSIAFPVLSTGSYKFPKLEALRIATNAILDFLSEDEMDVALVLFSKEMMKIAGKLFGGIENRIDDQYADSVDNRFPHMQRLRGEFTQSDWYGQKKEFKEKQQAPVPTGEMSTLMEAAEKRESFHEMLLRFISESGKTDPEIYKAALMQKQLYSKIKSKSEYMPGKKTILALAFAMNLTTEQTKELLMKAGYCLSDTDEFDIVMKYCLDRRKSDLKEVDKYLKHFGLRDDLFEKEKKNKNKKN